MISEEKVADIIQNKGSVWCINKWSKPYHIQQVVFDGKREFNPHTFTIGWGAENIYETEEEASEYLKYGDVTRTEKFPYVSWEEFCKFDKTIKFFNKEIKYSMYVFVKNKNTNNCRIIIYADDYTKFRAQDWIVFDQPLTQENYHKALDLAVRLWKGEE